MMYKEVRGTVRREMMNLSQMVVFEMEIKIKNLV